GAEKGAPQVEAQDEVPVLDLEVPDLRRPVAADVVDKDVEAAEALDSGRDEGGGRALVGDVADCGDDLATCPRDGVGRAPELGGVDVAQRDEGALLGQALRNRAADSLGRSRDHRDLSLNTTHDGSPRSEMDCRRPASKLP